MKSADVCDGKDNDCSGGVDDDPEQIPLCAIQLGVCSGARQVCAAGKLRACNSADYLAHSQDFEGSETLCDGLDNDCNGETDEFPGCQGADAGTPDASEPDAAGDAGGPVDGGVGDVGIPGQDGGPARVVSYDLGGCGCGQGAGIVAPAAALLALLAWRRRRRN